LQAFSDAIKLLSKTITFNKNSNRFLFTLSPVGFFICYLVLYFYHPHEITNSDITIRVLIFSSILCSTVFPLFIRGWASNRKYAIVGSIRRVAQVISYEVRYRLVVIILVGRFSRIKIKYFSRYSSYLSCPLILVSLWVITILAETNRTPFDTTEGESELVSGFNVEFSRGGFVLIFLSEYLSIIVVSCTTVHCLLGFRVNSLLGVITRVLFMGLFIVVRGSWPRLRYDRVIKFA